MWLTPLFYAVLTFRTLKQLFQHRPQEEEQQTGKRPSRMEGHGGLVGSIQRVLVEGALAGAQLK